MTKLSYSKECDSLVSFYFVVFYSFVNHNIQPTYIVFVNPGLCI